MWKKNLAWLIAGMLIAGAVLSGTAQAGISDRLSELLHGRSTESRGQDSLIGEGVQRLAEHSADAINASLKAAAGSHSPKDGATKVVPIVSVGQGKAVGLAQVSGPAAAVHGVQAVVAVEVAIFGNKLQGRVLIPVDTRDISKGYKRVGQVGVAAMLDYRL